MSPLKIIVVYKQEQTKVEAQEGLSTRVQFFFSYYIFHFCSWPIFNSNSNYPIQKFNKNNKNINNGDCILAKKKKNYFSTKEPKKSCVIREDKINFFATIINWY